MADEDLSRLYRHVEANIKNANYFGDCPICGKNDGHLNTVGDPVRLGGVINLLENAGAEIIGRDGPVDHWFVCHEHRVRWIAGTNLFTPPAWETEASRKANNERIANYAIIEPLDTPESMINDHNEGPNF
jgi:hypothetical protein